MPQIDEQALRARIASAAMPGGWQINEVLGRGRRSVVFDISRVTQTGEEHSALKAICEYPSAEELAKYEAMGMTAKGIKSLYADRAEADLREIRAMQQMQGEAFLVTYYDFDIVKVEDAPGEIILIRMEKLTPLKSYLRFTPLTEKKVVSIALCTAKALEACHGLNPTPLVHGDVKPDNLYHFKGDIYKLGDFGISNSEGADRTVLPAGTPYYMAPESSSMGASPLSDIYSLGKTMLYLLGAGEVTSEERPPACRSDELWELIRQMISEVPAERPADIGVVIDRLNSLQADETHSWYLNTDAGEGQTLTDILERKTEKPDELFSAEDSDSKQTPPQAFADEPAQKGAVSEELDESFKKELDRRKRKKRNVWFTVLGIAAVSALVALLLIFAPEREEDEQALAAKLSMQLEVDGSMLVQWSDAGKEASIAVYSANSAAWNETQRILESTTVDFIDISDGSRMVFAAGENGELCINGLAPDTLYHAELLGGERALARSEVRTAQVVTSPTIQSITHLLYSFQKPADGEPPATHEQLSEQWLLEKMESKTQLRAGKEFFEKNGIYVHITCKDIVEDASLLVCLRLGNETYAVRVNAANGTAGIFGGNKLYVLLDPVLEHVQVTSEEACEIRFYARDGLIYAFEGTIS